MSTFTINAVVPLPADHMKAAKVLVTLETVIEHLRSGLPADATVTWGRGRAPRAAKPAAEAAVIHPEIVSDAEHRAVHLAGRAMAMPDDDEMVPE